MRQHRNPDVAISAIADNSLRSDHFFSNTFSTHALPICPTLAQHTLSLKEILRTPCDPLWLKRFFSNLLEICMSRVRSTSLAVEFSHHRRDYR